MPEQLTIDFEAAAKDQPLREMWERNMAVDAHNWTEETMARTWCHCHPEVWATLPVYERNAIMAEYHALQTVGKSPLPPFKPICNEESTQQKIDIAKRMAAQLAADWSANRPPSVFTCDPIIASTVSMLLGRRVEAAPISCEA